MYTATLPGREMAVRFQSLGNIAGMPLSQIISVVGPPTARSVMANDQVLYQWQATGFHIAILFDANDRLLRITSEYANIPEPAGGDVASGIGAVIAIVVVVLGGLLTLAQHC
jgi:hypothetical protein